MKELLNDLKNACEENELHCFVIIGDDKTYETLTVGDYSEIEESLYFALSQDISQTRRKRLYNAFSSAVKSAADLEGVETN